MYSLLEKDKLTQEFQSKRSESRIVQYENPSHVQQNYHTVEASINDESAETNAYLLVSILWQPAPRRNARTQDKVSSAARSVKVDHYDGSGFHLTSNCSLDAKLCRWSRGLSALALTAKNEN